MNNIIEIEGVQWQLIERPKTKAHGLSGLGSYMAMAGMLAGVHALAMGGSTYTRPAPKVNIVDEFILIQQKKSRLSRRERDWVESQFYRNFRKVKPKAQLTA